MNIKPIITEEKSYKLLGSVFYGDPFHSAHIYSRENEIGQLSLRYYKIIRKYWHLLRKNFVNLNIGYELHIETEEYVKTKKYYVFFGTEIKEYKEIPLEMFIKVLPKTNYLMFTTKAIDKYDLKDFFFKWLPQSKYEQAHPFIFLIYDFQRFKSFEDEESELDYYIPIKRERDDSSGK